MNSAQARPFRPSTIAVAALVVALALAGCTKKKATTEEAATTTVTTVASTSSAPATTATTKAPTTTATKPPPSPPATPITIPSPKDGHSPEGSGCTPPAGDTLPDGIWFGMLKSVDPASGRIGLDLACFFVGDAANAAAAADGGSEVPVPNDYYIRNNNPKVYELATASDVAVLEIPNMGSGPGYTTSSGLAAAQATLTRFGDHWIGWVQITDGWVVVMQQQFVP